MDFPSYPARPINGGALECAPPKIGAWAWQPKVDDWRAIIHTTSGRVWNRHGQPSSVTGKLTAALEQLRDCPFEWLDAGIMECRHDMMRGSLIVFDYMPPASQNCCYALRRQRLETHFKTLPLAAELLQTGSTYDAVFLINHWWSDADPLALWRLMQEQNARLGRKFYEGLVAKRVDKSYPLQLRSATSETPWMMKHRFDQ